MALAKKKIVKVVRKVAARKVAKKSAKRAATTANPQLKLGKPNSAKASLGKPIGVVTHFFGHISVGIVKFSKPVKVGTDVRFYGATTDFTQPIVSMQYEHQPITVAKKGQQVGIKVKKKVHEGNKVYLAAK